ncbi:MAG TPA: hypothetical protein VJN92_23930 [Candidatus Acidoferrum sp.]|nr:hypothetical protein [Candidatus Acidoferrum sp.]
MTKMSGGQRGGNASQRLARLAITPGEKYSAQYMEAVFIPGMTSNAHNHSAPEAWYTMTGETCLETSDGIAHVGRAGGPPLILPVGLSMHLAATGSEKRRALALILHETTRPPTTLVHDWVIKACRVSE